jgi:hypothetical protein
MSIDWKPELDTVKATVVTVFTTLVGKIQTMLTRLNAHTEATGNVHDLSPADIGLELTPNYAPATLLEAAGAANNTTVMTPARTNDWAEENVYGPIAEAFGNAADQL